MFGKKKSRKPRAGIGSGYLLKLTIGIIALMIGNSWLAGLFVQANIPWLPELLRDVRVYQFFQIDAAFLMVVIQFWIYDRLRDRMGAAQTERL